EDSEVEGVLVAVVGGERDLGAENPYSARPEAQRKRSRSARGQAGAAEAGRHNEGGRRNGRGAKREVGVADIPDRERADHHPTTGNGEGSEVDEAGVVG